MCPLGDPNSGSSGMCLCVGMWRAEGGGPGGGGCGLWNACPCVRHCLGSCVVSKLYERGAQLLHIQALARHIHRDHMVQMMFERY